MIVSLIYLFFNPPQFIEKFLFQIKHPVKLVKISSPQVLSTSSGKIVYPANYTIVLLGDSMTETLGNADELISYLSQSYPNKTFQILNYGFGSTNILSAPDRLTQKTFHGRDFRPILDINFDLVIIESFGENPLSEYSRQYGLNIQSQTLDKMVQTIREKSPNSKIVFMATIAPNSKNFAKNQVDLSEEQRTKWVDERKAYMKNHIAYARLHNIPLIDIFDDSLDKDGDGKMIYIRTDDYIHPSPVGIKFISWEIADFIYKNQLLQN